MLSSARSAFTQLSRQGLATARSSASSLHHQISHNINAFGSPTFSRFGTLSSTTHNQLVQLGLATPSWKKIGGAAAGALLVGSAIGQHYYGYKKDFYEYRFIVDADPDDLAGFYGAESFMDLFCVLPFMGTLMMRGGYFDDEGTVHTTGFPAGEMLVSMVFSDDDDEEGTTKWFNKRERFKNVFMNKYVLWDMVTNFGFERMDDGRLMVYHHGEYFNSRFPPFSLLVQLVFRVHARWVAWATEHHLNHYAFKEGDLQEEWEEESRVDMPLFLLKNYAWLDLMGALFGRKLEQPSFLLEQAQESSLAQDEEEEGIVPLVMNTVIPVKRANIQRHITIDIDLDRRENLRRSSLRKEADTVAARTTKRRESIKEPLPQLQRHGSVAWRMLKATNNPESYMAVTEAARERQLARQLTRRLSKAEEKHKKALSSDKPAPTTNAGPTDHLPTEKRAAATEEPILVLPNEIITTVAQTSETENKAHEEVAQLTSVKQVENETAPAEADLQTAAVDLNNAKEQLEDPALGSSAKLEPNSAAVAASTKEEATKPVQEMSRRATTGKKAAERVLADLTQQDSSSETKSV